MKRVSCLLGVADVRDKYHHLEVFRLFMLHRKVKRFRVMASTTGNGHIPRSGLLGHSWSNTRPILLSLAIRRISLDARQWQYKQSFEIQLYHFFHSNFYYPIGPYQKRSVAFHSAKLTPGFKTITRSTRRETSYIPYSKPVITSSALCPFQQ